MSRDRIKLITDLVLLLIATLTFVSGCVLLLRFHVGGGAWRSSTLGLDRLLWLNLHRLGALVLALSLTAHLVLDRRALLARLRALLPGGKGRSASELSLYLAFLIVLATGFSAWLILEGSTPLLGPLLPGRMPQGRHHMIDLHNVGGVLALILAIHHVGHRWRWMTRRVAEWIGSA